ncbi:hypothetical protein HYV43_00555 [Candidatus Micrarchaeota archaeon]|nr:hypothetical protein [Candidatus Micrarchaeota archaeon]
MLLFLSSVLFTVNLNKIESAQSARIVNDAYHNRIVSLIEIYRTDLNSIFRESVRRNIQEYILEPGWNTLDPKNIGDDIVYPSTRFLNIREVRNQRCERVRQLARTLVCGTGEASSSSTFGYGIPAWVEVARQAFTFEGIAFRPANAEQMSLLNPPSGLPTDEQTRANTAYRNACLNLVQENLFDCEDFSRNPRHYQCKYDGRVIPGCEEGTFYMRVDPRGINAANPDGDSALYAALPRIEGDDGFGNQVRSGAIGDEPFYLPINLRVFFYDDFALEFYNRLGFNADASGNPQAGGLITGMCFGSSAACRDPPPGGPGVNAPPLGPGMPVAGNNAILVRNRLLQNLAARPYRNAVQGLRDWRQAASTSPFRLAQLDSSGRWDINPHMLFKDDAYRRCLEDATPPVPSTKCLNIIDRGFGLTPAEVYDIPGLRVDSFAYVPTTGNQEYSAGYAEASVDFFVLDYRPEFRVKGTAPNNPRYGMLFRVQS